MKPRITQRQVAQATHVSLSTVSRVYSGHPGIPEKTCERVRKVGEQLGYRPSPGLSAVQSARWKQKPAGYSRLVYILTDDPEQRKYASAVTRAQSRFPVQAEERGYGLEFIDLSQMSPEALRRKLEFLRVDCIVVPMVPALPSAIEEVLASWPCVGMMAQTPEVAFPVVYLDDLMHAYEVFKRVSAYGYTRTGIVAPPQPFGRGVLGRLGGLLASREWVNGCNIPLLREPSTTLPMIEQYVHQHACDSLIFMSGPQCQQFREEYPDLRHLGMAGIYLLDEDTSTAGIRNQPELYHERVLDLLDWMVRGNITGRDLTDMHESVKFPWQEGQTLTPVHDS